VIRAWVLARQRELGEALAEDEGTPLAVLSGLALWTLRLMLAPPSTLRGFRKWVLDECPVAPGRREIPVPAPATALELPIAEPEPAAEPDETETDTGTDKPAPEREPRRTRMAGPSKTSRFIEMVVNRHGPLAAIDPAHVSRIATDLAPEVGLNPGAARSALRPKVLAAAQNGHSS
jgi:hypothetical protein